MLLTCSSHVRPARPLGARRQQGAFGGCRLACLRPLRAGQLFGKLFGGGDDTDSDGTGGAQPQEEGGKLVPIDGEGGLGGTETFGPLVRAMGACVLVLVPAARCPVCGGSTQPGTRQLCLLMCVVTASRRSAAVLARRKGCSAAGTYMRQQRCQLLAALQWADPHTPRIPRGS